MRIGMFSFIELEGATLQVGAQKKKKKNINSMLSAKNQHVLFVTRKNTTRVIRNARYGWIIK